jgi:chemotaxis protein MotB
MKNRVMIPVLLTLSLAAAGCVSTSKYDKLEADKNLEITNLQSEKSALQEQIAAAKNEVEALQKQKTALQTDSAQRQSQYDALVKKLSSEVQQGQLQVRQYQNMLSVDVAEKIFFDSGRAELKDTGKDVLKKVGDALKTYDKKIIRVVGYTDNVPIAKATQSVYPTNWELSVARATNVVRQLQEVGVPPERMIASGRGEYSPIASNDTPEGRQKNRRIEIMLVDQALAEEMSKAQR